MSTLAGLSDLNRQALIGVACLIAVVLLVYALNARWLVRMPGGAFFALSARILLGFCLAAGLWYLGSALFGRVV